MSGSPNAVTGAAAGVGVVDTGAWQPQIDMDDTMIVIHIQDKIMSLRIDVILPGKIFTEYSYKALLDPELKVIRACL